MASKSKQPKPAVESAAGARNWLMLIPAVLGFLLYVNTLGHDYTLDDFTVIDNHTHVQNGFDGLGDIMTTNYRHGMGKFNDGLYRPLSVATFAIEQELFGNDTFIRHFNNALLYALTGLLLFLLGRRLFPNGGEVLPLILSLVFIAHPIHTEGVANVKGRDEVMAFLFFVLSAIAYLDYLKSKKVGHLLALVVWFALAMLSKESSITYLAAIPVLGYFFADKNLKNLAVPTAVLVVMGAVMLGWRHYVMSNLENPVDSGIFALMNNSLFATESTLERLATAAWMQVMYVEKLVFPYELAYDYSYNQIPVIGLASAKAIAGIALVVGLLAWAVKGLRERDGVSAAILFYFITISVAANVFFMNGATFAERFAYTPAFAFALALAVLLHRLGRFGENPKLSDVTSKPVVAGILGVVLIAFSAQTVLRNADWKDNLTLYEADMDKVDGSARAHYSYGTQLYQRAMRAPANDASKSADLAEAVSQLKACIEIYDTYQDAYNNIALSYKLMGKPDSAIFWFEKLLTISDEIDKPYSKAWFNKATVHLQEKQYEAGITSLQNFVAMQPNSNANAYFLMGEAYGHLQQFDQAIIALENCLRINPNYADALSLLGQAYGIKQQPQQALQYFERAASVKPNNAETWYNIGLTYLMIGQASDAIPNLQKCLQLQPNHALAQQRLGQAQQQLNAAQP